MVINRIIKKRNEKGMTQTQVADILGMSQNNYSRIESRKIELTVSRLWEIANILDTPVTYFVDETDFQDQLNEAGFKIFDLNSENRQLKDEIIELQRKLIKQLTQ
jgi:transcriptional regulator with XRE-family HTH domain